MNWLLALKVFFGAVGVLCALRGWVLLVAGDKDDMRPFEYAVVAALFLTITVGIQP